MAIIERRLQGCLDKLVSCADGNGFKFSPTKTLCVHFCKKNGLQPEPNLKLYGQQLSVEEQDNLTEDLPVSHQIQTGLWLYCLWFSETIVLSST